MATVQDLKRRIRSVGNTQKITKAFELVASARLRRAQARIEAVRPYADRMLELMGVTARAAGSVRLPLLERREDVKRVALLPITADRGLAGAFNAQILRRAFALERELRGEGVEVSWLVAGRRGRSSLTFRGYELIQAWQGLASVRSTRRSGDCPARRRAVRERRGRPRRRHLQPLPVRARPARHRPGFAADSGKGGSRRRGRREAGRPTRRLHLRARARADPRTPAPGLRRD